MNENINLCEILKGHEGETFYCSLFGEDVKISWVYPNTICFKLNNNVPIELHHNGGFSPNGECQLFPSKDQRDWNKWIEEQKSKTPKTWSDINDEENIKVECRSCIGYPYDFSLIKKSAKALLKIHQLIEYGYGGNVTNDEWNNISITKWAIVICKEGLPIIISTISTNHIAFHTKEQAEEFLSKPENVQLLKDYFMI